MARRLARITETVLLSGTVAALIATGVAFCGDWHWYADLFAHFRPQYVIGFALVGAILLLRRRWKTAGLALSGIAINLTVMWPHAAQSEIALSPSSPNATAVSHAKVRVVSFNLLQGNEHLEAAERFLRECDADVIILQEVTPETATMLRRCEPIYPDQFIRGKKDSKGTALLTRLPVKNLRFEPAPGEELIGANIGEFTAPNGQLFTILGVHSHKPTSAKGAAGQDKYFDWLAERITTLRQSGTSLVVAGDFNATPWSPQLQTLHRRIPAPGHQPRRPLRCNLECLVTAAPVDRPRFCLPRMASLGTRSRTGSRFRSSPTHCGPRAGALTLADSMEESFRALETSSANSAPHVAGMVHAIS